MSTREATFEDRLLDELRPMVAQARPRPAPRRRLALGGVAVAGLAAVAATGTAVLHDGPAFAVERDPDGAVRVSIFDYRDPDGLRQRLAAFGVRAAVDFLPPGKVCREPRADYVPRDRMPLAMVDFSPLDGNQNYFRVHPEYLGPEQTFVYAVQVDRDHHEQRFMIRVANGPVAPCTQVPGRIGTPA
ncbi:hypothetical protein [Dactylosporangium salmoneum]|uniref:Uncharacterized protein n=1 Tax=Dactylosporangium salmoneum TaxID=53361 RepID=A0ABP5SEQ2_9ACTN